MSIRSISAIKSLIISLIFFILFTFSALAADISIVPSNTSVSPNTQFTVSINISAVSNLFGAAFDMIFNPAILQFISAQKGTFLEQDGVATNLLTVVSPPGDLIVGYSRLAINGVATGVSGSGVLMTLTFNALSAGASNLTFQNNSLCDASNPSGCNVILTNWNPGSVTVSGFVDIIPPSIPANLTATAVSSSQINLSWTASTDNVGVVGYRIYRCQGTGCIPAVQIATSTVISYFNTGLTASTTYVYQITAYDAAGNDSIKSNLVSATTPPNLISPKFFINQLIKTTTRVNVRKTPSLIGINLGFQNSAAKGVVIGGPVQSGGYIWWQINYDLSPDGWSVENWLIEDIFQAPPPPPVPPIVFPTSTKFFLNERVKTTANLNVRSAGSLSALRLGIQYTNTQGTVIASPVQADGYTWWKINYDLSPDGWSVENWLEKVVP